MRVTCVFDVEDYVTPPEGGMDELLQMLAEVMTETGVSGTFFLIGERLRCLRNRGRADVIEAIARHDIGSHTNMGSIHPTLTERVAAADWTNGLAMMVADELAAFDEMGQIFGRAPKSFARHGGSYCPQLIAALSSRNAPYVYSPAQLPGHNITWFCNTLNFAGSMLEFQEAYLSREAFDAANHDFYEFVAEQRTVGIEWIGLFNSHPSRIKSEWFWDRNYYHGRNPSPEDLVPPDFRPDYDLAAARENWTLHCNQLRDDPDLTIGTISDFAAEFGGQAETATPAEVMALAAQAADSCVPFFTDRFTAAEILDLLASAYTKRETGRDILALPRRDVYGPTALPIAVPSMARVSAEALLRAASGVVIAIERTGHLPAQVRCGAGPVGSAGEIGMGSLMQTLGQALSTGSAGADADVAPGSPYPEAGDTVAHNALEYRDWGPHRRDLDMSQICRLTALQSWTLKPAWAELPEFAG